MRSSRCAFVLTSVACNFGRHWICSRLSQDTSPGQGQGQGHASRAVSAMSPCPGTSASFVTAMMHLQSAMVLRPDELLLLRAQLLLQQLAAAQHMVGAVTGGVEDNVPSDFQAGFEQQARGLR